MLVMYQSIPSMTTPPPPPPGDPRGFALSHCPGGRVFAQLSLLGGQGFELKKFVIVLKENAGTSRFVSKKPGAA